MLQKVDDKPLYKALRVDEETYGKIGRIAKKEGLTRLQCAYYMARYFEETGTSVYPKEQRTLYEMIAQIRKEQQVQTDRSIKVIKAMEGDILRSIQSRVISLQNDMIDILERMKERQAEEADKCENKHNETVGQPNAVELTVEILTLRDELRQMKMERDRTRMQLKSSLELLEEIIDPDMLTKTGWGAESRVRKFRLSDIERYQDFIRRCTLI